MPPSEFDERFLAETGLLGDARRAREAGLTIPFMQVQLLATGRQPSQTYAVTGPTVKVTIQVPGIPPEPKDLIARWELQVARLAQSAFSPLVMVDYQIHRVFDPGAWGQFMDH